MVISVLVCKNEQNADMEGFDWRGSEFNLSSKAEKISSMINDHDISLSKRYS